MLQRIHSCAETTPSGLNTPALQIRSGAWAASMVSVKGGKGDAKTVVSIFPLKKIHAKKSASSKEHKSVLRKNTAATRFQTATTAEMKRTASKST